ncbi:MAG: aminopeptidase N [Lysobacterales bacterium]
MTDNHRPTAPIRLADYRPPAFLIDRVELQFDLDFAETLVSADLHFRRNPAAAGRPALRLDGEDLDLRAIALDGRPLAANEYATDPRGLTVAAVPDQGVLHTRVAIAPSRNTRLEGLYQSGEFLTTQCEAEGFRRITYFPDRPDVMARYTVTLNADRERFPVLLSNGNPKASGELGDGRHFARWVDPWPKPSYLFALVAGRLAHREDHFTTCEGRQVRLCIYAEDSAIGRCQHAMASLKRAMRWDELQFGRAYDLDVFNIVATFDFNMGAMENKGLNIFNAKGIVADPATATDADLAYVEAVVAHEYFHNWTGNRITCRDWFQLSLKEGLTVYRDQAFSADMGSRVVKRIDDVRRLRAVQFIEDAGPFAHPVRPSEYVEINNFYTATVYEKGAQVVRLYHTLLGHDGFRRGMDRYFERFDGQAVTVDDFRAAMAEANGRDLAFLLPWYSQAGTPELTVREHYDAARAHYRLDFSQHTAATPGQASKQPLPIPVRLQLYGANGAALPLRLIDEPAAVGEQRVLLLGTEAASFTFADMAEPPVPSLLQDFSAPVRLRFDEPAERYAFRLAHDQDPFNRWEASQTLAERLILKRYAGSALADQSELAIYADALERLLAADHRDPALIAECLDLPDEAYLAERLPSVDPLRLFAARRELGAWLGARFADRLLQLRRELAEPARGDYHAAATAARRLRGRALHLLMAADPGAHAPAAFEQFAQASTMTERMAALVALVHAGAETATPALKQFYREHQSDPLLIDKWLSVQATNPGPATLARVQALSEHPAFSWQNPNKVRALIGAFVQGNRPGFHAADGGGYRLLSAAVARLDRINPQIAARLLAAFNGWRRLEPGRQGQMRAELEQLAQLPGLSSDCAEIIQRALA